MGMLVGAGCPSSRIKLTENHVRLAMQRLDMGFAFIGITSEWPLSVCLFHAMHGGKCHKREFKDVSPHKKHRQNETDLRGFVDVIDGALYRHVLDVFNANL